MHHTKCRFGKKRSAMCADIRQDGGVRQLVLTAAVCMRLTRASLREALNTADF